MPVLEIDGHSMTQSLAILEYLNDTREMGLISSDPTSAAQERAIAHAMRLIFIPCAMFRLPPMRYNNQDGTKLVLNGCNGLLHLASPVETMLNTRPQTAFAHGDAPTYRHLHHATAL